MPASRLRRVSTSLLSTLAVVAACRAATLCAQTSSDGWPFDDPPSAAAPQPKTVVQKKIEELYRRDGRALPDYMHGENTSPAITNAAPASDGSGPAPGHTPPPNGPAMQRRQPPPNQGTVKQQLSDYYQTQGQTMPNAQRGSDQAAPMQAPARPAAQAKPRLIDRLNPFRRFSAKENPNASTTNGGSAGQPAGQPPRATSFSAGSGSFSGAPYGPAPQQPVYDGRQSANSFSGTPIVNRDAYSTAPVPQAVRPPVGGAASSRFSVELGTAAPMASGPPIATRSTLVPPIPNSVAPPQTASRDSRGLPEPAKVESAVAPNGPANGAANDLTTPFQEMSEIEADNAAGAYSGLSLDDDQKPVRAAVAGKPADPSPGEAAGHATTAQQGPASPTQQTKSAERPNAQSASPATQPPAPSPRSDSNRRPAPSSEGAPKALPAPQVSPRQIRRTEDAASKMRRIGERVGQRGLKGFCPVALRDRRDLVDGKVEFSVMFESNVYCMSSAEAKAEFERNPKKYSPAADGLDIVVKANSDQSVNGMLDYAAWYKDRLFLFTSPESLHAFTISPAPYATPYLARH